MRFVMPRAQFWFAILLMAVTVFAARESWGEWSRAAILTETEKRGAFMQAFGAIVTFLIGLALFVRALKSDFPLRVIGESFTGEIELSGGETFGVAPLYGLAQTQLVVVLSSSTAPSPRPHFRSFRLYRGARPEKLEPKFEVQLFGRDGQNATLIAHDCWPGGSGVVYNECEPSFMELNVTEEHESYFLRVQLKSAPDENAVFETTIKLGVALKMRDAARFRSRILARRDWKKSREMTREYSQLAPIENLGKLFPQCVTFRWFRLECSAVFC